MQIIQTPPPKLDAADPQVNFIKIQQYLQNTIESIDFILARYAGELKIVDTDGVDQKLKEVKSQMVTLDRTVTGIKNEQNTIGKDLTALKKTVEGLSGSMGTLQQGLSEVRTTLTNHENRIKALENPGGGA